jgi:hypothetical protein
VNAFGAAGVALLWQVPEVAWQTLAVWAQVTAGPDWHTPALQTSFWVQPFESEQGVRSAACGLEHVPVPGSHTPAMWHELLAVHVVVAPPWQTPPEQVIPVWQRFGPWQEVPSAFPKHGSFEANAKV